ncbi:MAG: protein kinase [Pirellulales bacterium]
MQIGRFIVQRELGMGGHGIVFLAFDSLLQRQVALKLARPETVASADLRVRFIAEARAVARLSHTNIVSVYDVGELGPICYIASEYCPGPSLARWLSERADNATTGPSGRGMSARPAAELISAVADAVAHAHARGILHRDIKPSNVLLFPDEQKSPDQEAVTYVPKLIDFGLARIIESDVDRTRTGVLVGTPSYMAPEQAAGRTHEISALTDVYGLGAILYEVLSGQPPFGGESPLQIVRQVLTEDVIPFSELGVEVPKDLQSICLKCLDKTAGRRYSSAGDLSADLQRYLRGEPTIAQPVTSAARLAKWARRRPAVAALIGAVVLSSLMLIVNAVIYASRLRIARDDAVAAQQVSENRRREMKQLAYAVDMRLANEAMEIGRVDEARRLLAKYLPERDPDHEDMREFAWRYLWQRCKQPLISLRGHQGPVLAIAAAHERNWYVSGGADGAVKLWKLGREPAPLIIAQEAAPIVAVEFSADDRWIGWSDATGIIGVFDLPAGRRVHYERHADAGVTAIKFSPDGDELAVAAEDGHVRLWKTDRWELLADLTAHDGPVTAIDYSSDGRSLASCGADGRGVEWNRTDHQQAKVFEADHASMACVRYSPLQYDLVTLSTSGKVTCWNRENGKVRWELPTDVGRGASLAFSPDGMLLVAAGSNGQGELCDAIRGVFRGRVTAHGEPVTGIAFSADGFAVASSSLDGTGKVVDIARAGVLKSSVMADRGEIARSAEGKIFAFSRSLEGPDRIDSYLEGRRTTWVPPDGHRALLESLTADRLARCAMARDIDGHISAWDPSRLWRPVGELLVQDGTVVFTFWSASGQWIGFARDKLKLWNVSTGQRDEYPLSAGAAWADASLDGRQLVIGLNDGTIQVWAIDESGVASVRQTIVSANRGVMLTGRLVHGGRWCAVAYETGEIVAYDLADGTRMFDLIECEGVTTRLVESPDGLNLCAWDSKGFIRVWDLRTRRQVLRIATDFPNLTLDGMSHHQLVGHAVDSAMIWTGWAEDEKREDLWRDWERIGQTVNPKAWDRLVQAAGTQILRAPQPGTLPLNAIARPAALPTVFDEVVRYGGIYRESARPTFVERESDDGLDVGVLFLEGVTATNCFLPAGLSFAERQRLVDQAVQRDHQSAGFCNFFSGREYSIFVLKPGTFDRRWVSAGELGPIEGEIDCLREVTRWAKRKGYVGGFPTFEERGEGNGREYMCVVIKPEGGREVYAPSQAVWRRSE